MDVSSALISSHRDISGNLRLLQYLAKLNQVGHFAGYYDIGKIVSNTIFSNVRHMINARNESITYFFDNQATKAIQRKTIGRG